MTRPCKIGVQMPEVERFVPWPEYIDLARRVEAAGFDSVWVGDHLLYDLPDGSTRGPYEAWTALAAIAQATERVEIGPLVASTSFHAPAMLAKQAATVDAISGGRLIDRKSTRLNSSHLGISYAVFCLKKKKKN